MRLGQKLSFAFVLGSSAILAANGYLRVRRETAVFEADRARDHDLFGRAIGASVAAVWRSEGEERALQLLAAANAGEGKIRVRWVWPTGAEAATDLHVDGATLAGVAPGTTLTRIVPDSRGVPERFTYAIVPLGDRIGALELSENLEAERAYVRRTVIETVRTTVVLALTTALVSYLLGLWLVGRPVRALVDKARRIGRGDFGGPLELTSRDELSELAAELNASANALVQANGRVARETAARIATLEQLRHADRLTTVGKLASGVAHELGTPLNVVGARAQMIAAGEASPSESRDYARVIVESAQKMTRIIRQLLEFARRQDPRKEKHDVAAVARRGLELLRPLAQKQRVELALDESGATCETNVDSAQIEQALTNLVVNAIQAMSGPGEVTVRVRRERKRPPVDHGGPEGEWIAVHVSDTGRGIPSENLSRVFEPFFTTKDVGEGTGLGLSVAYGIVRDHDGWIDVWSEPGKGSTFTVFLPTEPTG
jgi:two-component system, NtrC family, sensor kinase